MKRWADDETDSAPGFLDSSIILLMSAALVLFLLWATSRTIGVNSFENLPSWLERSSNAIWTSFVSGILGICLVFAKVKLRLYESHPNYLLLIGITTIIMLVLIYLLPLVFNRNRAETNPALLTLGVLCVVAAIVFFNRKNGTAGTMLLATGMIFVLVSRGQAIKRFQVGPNGIIIEFVQANQVLLPQALAEHQETATRQLSDQIEQTHVTQLDKEDVERSVAHLMRTFAGEGYIPLSPTRNVDIGTILVKQDGRVMEVARGEDVFGTVPTEAASAPAIHYESNGLVLDCSPTVRYARLSSIKSPASADLLQRLSQSAHGGDLFVVASTVGCQDLKVNGVDLGEKPTLAVKLAKLNPVAR